MADKEPGVCPLCQKPGIRRAKDATYRRGERFVTVTAAYWECTNNCPMPEAKDPDRYPLMAWEDVEQMKATTAQAKLAWIAKYGEDMPPGRIIRRKGDDNG